MKKVFIYILVLVFANVAISQTTPRTFDLKEYGVKIEPDKKLIAVMAALDFAGLETPLNNTSKEFRDKLRQDMVGLDPELQLRMKTFINNYRKRKVNASPAELAAPFISMAYGLGPAPDFIAPARSTDLPDDLLEVLDFAVFLKDFYRVAKLDTKINAYYQLYQTEGDKMRYSAAEMVTGLLDYLRTKPNLVSFERVETYVPDPKNSKKTVKSYRTVEKDRRFFIVPDLLATAGTVNFRNIQDDYFVIVPPNTNLRNSEARRGYLQYVLDPLIRENAKDIAQFREGIKVLLEERRAAGAEVSPDVFLAVLRSLVAAVDAREMEYRRIEYATALARIQIDKAKDVAAKQAVSAKLNADKQVFADETAFELSEAYQRGAVLAFYFAQQLKGVEDSGFDINGSFRDMILTLDTTKEKDRFAQFADARKRALVAREARKKLAAQKAVQSQIAYERAKVLKVKIEDIDKITANKDYPESTARLQKLLEEFPEESSSIYYSLGRVASLSAEGNFDDALRNSRLDTAKTFYINALNSSSEETDPALIQLTYVALGRIFEYYEENNAAFQIYQTATKFGNLKGGAFDEAVAAIKRLTEPKKP